jgi:hypothetical protein
MTRLMKRFFFLPVFLLFALLSKGQSTGQIEDSILGTWHLMGTTELSIPDSLYPKLQSEGVLYMIFDERKEAFIKFSSSGENQYYNGNYKVHYDKKSNSKRIKLKGPFCSCEEQYIEIVSITDTTLTVRSCRNPIDLIFVKSPLPKAKIEQVKTNLQGKWNHAKTEHSCDIEDSIKEISNRYENVISLQFYQDSVHILFNNQQKPITSEYYIHYDTRFDLLSLVIPLLSQKRCDPVGLSFVELTKSRMVLMLCDCDFSQVIYQKQLPAKE